jgi:hypothetical protein
MNPAAWSGVPQLDRFLGDAVVPGLRSLLGEDLLGVALVGSYVLGGADSASDCDVVAVLHSKPRRSNFEGLSRLLTTWSPDPWFWPLDLCLVAHDELNGIDERVQVLRKESGSQTLTPVTEIRAVLVRSLQQRAKALHGSAWSTQTLVLRAHQLSAAMRLELPRLVPDILQHGLPLNDTLQLEIVEELSLMAYALEHDSLASRITALRWLLGQDLAEGHQHVLLAALVERAPARADGGRFKSAVSAREVLALADELAAHARFR